MNARHARPLIAAIALAALLASCGDTVTIIECPLGTRPDGSQCVPWDDGGGTLDAATGDSVQDVTSTSDTTTFPTLDTTPGGRSDVGPAQAEVETTDPAAEEGKVGAACKLNSECDGGTCLDMPGGYCTLLDCQLTGCPAGAACVDLPGGNTGCLAECAAVGDCRADQACKPQLSVDGGDVTVCHGVVADAGGVGGLCDGDVDCAGANLCSPMMPGGYCTVTPCEAGGCPEDSVCVDLGGATMCLLACDSDDACGGDVDAERRCAPVASLASDVVSVCISAVSGQPIGGACSSDFDCESVTCEVLGHGRCSQSGLPCEPQSPGDTCSAAEACLDQGQGAVGRCTQPCATDLGCPGGAFCVGDAGAAAGLCRPSCAGLGASDDCPGEDGFQCGFGFALGDTQAQGRYLCDLPAPADVGASCGGAEACPAGTCESGACTMPCDADLYCPFPGVCVTGAPAPTCRKACLSSADCPGGTSCATQAGALGSFCQ